MITHMHDDHVSGIDLLAEYLYLARNGQKLNIVIPKALESDMKTYLDIIGVSADMYHIWFSDVGFNWLRDTIATNHTPELSGKCFGYHVQVNGRDVIYTGDTATLQPFEQI